jgi:hypothetical protein
LSHLLLVHHRGFPYASKSNYPIANRYGIY